MWFAFGLITLAVCTAWLIRYRWNVRWTGDRTRHRDISYLHRFLHGKDRVIGLQVGFAVPEGFRFELKRETWVDRFFKWAGLSVEKQFGRLGFDRLVYVASNDEHLINRIADSPALRAAAMQLFLVDTQGCRLRGVFCAHGHLWADIRVGRVFGRDGDVDRMNRCATRVLPHLKVIADALSLKDVSASAPGSRDRYLFRAVLLLSISSALAINGLVFLFRALVIDDRFTMDVWELWLQACLLGAVVVGLLLLANICLLGRSARAHLVLLELLLVGSFGAVTTAAAELRDANIEWDRAAPVLLEPVIVDKSISRSRKGGTSYYLHVPDWYGQKGTRRIKVSSGFFNRAQVGQALQVEQYPGRYGFRWAQIRGIKTAPPKPSAQP